MKPSSIHADQRESRTKGSWTRQQASSVKKELRTHQNSAGQCLGGDHHPRPVFHGGHPADLGCHHLLFLVHWLESAISLAGAIVNLLGLLATERTRVETF